MLQKAGCGAAVVHSVNYNQLLNRMWNKQYGDVVADLDLVCVYWGEEL